MNVTWYLIGAIFAVGIWGVIAQRNVIKKIIALSIANSAIIMLFIYFGSRSGNTAPILTGALAEPIRPVKRQRSTAVRVAATWFRWTRFPRR